MRTKWLVCIGLATALAGCGEKAAVTAPTKFKDATLEKSGGLPLTEAQFAAAGKTWPLTVPEAAVGCSPPAALWVVSKGKRFGLNEWATPSDGYLDLQRIQKVDEKAMEAAQAQAAEEALPEQAPKKKKRAAKGKEIANVYVDEHDLAAAAKARCGG